MPTFRQTSAEARRPGFSLIEILVVLAIFALSTAVIMPSMSRVMDQATSHAVFFEFQKQVSDYRREANRTGVAIQIVDPAADRDFGRERPEADGDADRAIDDENMARTIALRSPWRYTLAPTLDIAAGGACSASTANLINGDRIVMTLRAAQGDCQFIRLQTGAAPPRGSSSR